MEPERDEKFERLLDQLLMSAMLFAEHYIHQFKAKIFLKYKETKSENICDYNDILSEFEQMRRNTQSSRRMLKAPKEDTDLS